MAGADGDARLKARLALVTVLSHPMTIARAILRSPDRH